MTRTPSPDRRRPGTPHGRLAVVALLAALAALVAGCSNTGGDKAQTEDTIETTTTGGGGVLACEDVEPGVVVDRTLAVIHFDPENVCPGWVTVEQGTQVTFVNDDRVARTVVVTATQLPDSAEVARFTVEPGASQPLDTRDVARMGFTTDALPGFRGTIEVVDATGAGGMDHEPPAPR